MSNISQVVPIWSVYKFFFYFVKCCCVFDLLFNILEGKIKPTLWTVHLYLYPLGAWSRASNVTNICWQVIQIFCCVNHLKRQVFMTNNHLWSFRHQKIKKKVSYSLSVGWRWWHRFQSRPKDDFHQSEALWFAQKRIPACRYLQDTTRVSGMLHRSHATPKVKRHTSQNKLR